MRLLVVGVGRLKTGPERELVERYAERARQLGRGLGLAGPDLLEVPESHARRDLDRRAQEAEAIRAKAGGAALFAFDERGRSPDSATFARAIRSRQESGRAALAFVIGGADGLDPSIRQDAELVVSFGALTLPHQLVRVLVVEQLYRSLTILAGHPYHRGGLDRP